MAFIVEQWAGTSGSWPGAWTVTAGGGSATLSSDKGLLTTAAAAWSVTRAGRAGLANFDALFEVTFPNVTAEHYFEFCFRNSSATAFGNGYSFGIGPGTGEIYINKWTSGSEVALDYVGSVTFTAGQPYYVRVRASGSSLQVRMWPKDLETPEPDTWDLEAADSAYTTAGSIQFSLMTATGVRTCNIDTLFIDDLSITPGDGTQVATAQGWGTPTYEQQFTSAASSIDDAGDSWEAFEGLGYQGRGTFTRAQVTVHDGVMTLHADQAGNSASVAWYPPDSQVGDRWEVRWRVPYGEWLWTAIPLILWPLDDIWPGGGEMDVAEFAAGSETGVGTNVTVGSNIHYAINKDSENFEDDLVEHAETTGVNITTWHNSAIEWLPGNRIRTWLDGVLVHDITYAENPEIFPPRPMRYGAQLDWYDDNTPEETIRAAALQVAWVRRYAVESTAPRSGTDSATATDTAALAASAAGTDSATGTDAGALAASAAGADTAALAETATIAVSGPADTATASETAALDATATASDTATLAETATIAISGPADSAAVTDAGTVTVTLTASDTATLDDQAAVDTGATSQTGSDTATATEAGAVTAILSATDTATLAETAQVDESQPHTGTDAATTSEAADLAADLEGSDTVSAAETIALGVGLAQTDTATASEQLQTLDADITTAEGAQLADTAATSATLAAVPDAAQLTDSAALTVGAGGQDQMVAAEAADLAAGAVAADLAQLDGSVLAAVSVGATDTATTTDSLQLQATAASTDTATASDVGTLTAGAAGADTATTTSTADMAAAVTAAQAAGLADVAHLGTGILAAETATITDTAALLQREIPTPLRAGAPTVAGRVHSGAPTVAGRLHAGQPYIQAA